MNRPIQALTSILSFPTISYPQRNLMDDEVFQGCVNALKKHYPLTFTQASITTFHKHTYLFHLKGSDDSSPLGLMGHYDVVPVSSSWSVPPFQGVIIDDYIYGRGALDMKGHLVAVFEAVERHLEKDLPFKQDLYIMMGHNEECSGEEPDSGAEAMMLYLKEKGVKLHLVIDEGGDVIDGNKLHVNEDIHVIGIGEKGYMDVKALVKDGGGHSSTPPPLSALIGPMKLGVYVETHKFKPHLNEATISMLKRCAPYATFPYSLIYRYPKLFKSFIFKSLLDDRKLAAHVRTTAVTTMAQGSASMNVLPQVGWINLNIRIAPHQRSQDIMNVLNKAKDSNVQLMVDFANEPTSISQLEDGVFDNVVECFRIIYPDMKLVVPALMIAATDARYMHDISDHVFRCCPFDSMKEDRHTVHADDERLSLVSFEKGITFFSVILEKFV